MRAARRLLALLGVALLGAAEAAAWLAWFSLRPLEPPRTPFDFTVKSGASLKSVARNLDHTTKTSPKMMSITPRRLLSMLPWVQVDGGTYRVNRTKVELSKAERIGVDNSEGNASYRVYFPKRAGDNRTMESGTAVRSALEVQGRTWAAECLPTSGLIAKRKTPTSWLVLVLGLTVTGMVAAYAQSLLSQTARVERLVVQRTSELQEANASLAYERFLLNTLLEFSPDYIYFKDQESRFIRISRALASYLGFKGPAAAVGLTDFDVFQTDLARQYRADEEEVMRTGNPVVNKEEEQILPSGETSWLLTSKVCLRDVNGGVVGTFGISRDITVRKKAEETLRMAREAAEAANRAKSD